MGRFDWIPGWSHWNFTIIFVIRKLQSLGYHAALNTFTRTPAVEAHRPVTYLQFPIEVCFSVDDAQPATPTVTDNFRHQQPYGLNSSIDLPSYRRFSRFWATVCKTVRPMLSDRCAVCLSCPVCLSVTFVYCGQTVGRIKMKLGTQIGFGPGHIALDGDPAPALPPPNGHIPNFWLIYVAAKWLHGSVWR